MAYGDFKDLTRRTASDKILHGKAFNIAKNPKCDGYQRGLASMVYKFFDKKTSSGAVKKNYSKWRISWSVIRNQIITNQLLENLKKGKYTHLL